MPPLMGAGAFVMVELTGVPYTSIMAAALLPAILYFLAVWIGVNAYASHDDLAGLDEKDQPSGRDVFITSCFFLIPFTVLLVGMFWIRFTPQYSASMAILASFLLLFFNAKGPGTLRKASPGSNAPW